MTDNRPREVEMWAVWKPLSGRYLGQGMQGRTILYEEKERATSAAFNCWSDAQAVRVRIVPVKEESDAGA